MATKQIRIGDDCIQVLESWRHPHESMSDAVRRMDRHLKSHSENGVK